MISNKISTADLIIKLNRYSFEDKAWLCLYFSVKACNYLEDFYRGKDGVTPPWLLDGFITLCLLSKPTTAFHKDIIKDGVKDKNYIFDALYNVKPPKWGKLPYENEYVLKSLMVPQVNYQKNSIIFLYRYSYIFSHFKGELDRLTGNVEYDKFIFIERVFSSIKDEYSNIREAIKVIQLIVERTPDIIKPLSISLEEIVGKTYGLYDDINDLTQFSYSFKFISSYPFVFYDNKYYLLGIHNYLNSITTGFMSRITDINKKASSEMGIVLEKYIYKIIDESKLVDAIEDDTIPYYMNGSQCRKPDVSFEENGKLVIIESKKAWSKIKASYNDKKSLEDEINKGTEECEKSLKNFIRFIKGKYTLCNKTYTDYKKVYLIMCIEKDNYWLISEIITRLKEKSIFADYLDFIDNNFLITTLYNIESYFLFNTSMLKELEREKEGIDRHLILKNSGLKLKVSHQLQEFVKTMNSKMRKYKDIYI